VTIVIGKAPFDHIVKFHNVIAERIVTHANIIFCAVSKVEIYPQTRFGHQKDIYLLLAQTRSLAIPRTSADAVVSQKHVGSFLPQPGAGAERETTARGRSAAAAAAAAAAAVVATTSRPD